MNALTIIVQNLDFPDSFLTGHAVIDNDHRQLIACINKINEYFREKQGAKAKKTCTALQSLMEEHAVREEKILQEAKFPRLNKHVESHNQLDVYCRAVLLNCNNACLRNKAGDCTTRLFMRIIEHIVGGDLDFKSYLQAKGLTETND